MPAKKGASPKKKTKESNVEKEGNSSQSGKRTRKELNYDESPSDDEKKTKKNEKNAKKVVEEEEEVKAPPAKKRGRPPKKVVEVVEEEEEEPVEEVKKTAKSKAAKEVAASKASSKPKTSPVKAVAASRSKSKETVREPEASDEEEEEEEHSSSGSYSKEAYDKLKKKYDDLLKLSSSSSKDDELKRINDEKTDKLVEGLYQKNAKLMEENKELKAKGSKGKDPALQSQYDELKQLKDKLEDNLKTKTQLLSFFQTLSGVTLKPSGENKYECECRNSTDAKKTLSFELTVTETEIEYSPLNASQFQGNLPQGLKQTICFTEDNLPKFLLQLLGAQYVR